jgi:hypothetical protein
VRAFASSLAIYICKSLTPTVKIGVVRGRFVIGRASLHLDIAELSIHSVLQFGDG